MKKKNKATNITILLAGIVVVGLFCFFGSIPRKGIVPQENAPTQDQPLDLNGNKESPAGHGGPFAVSPAEMASWLGGVLDETIPDLDQEAKC